ncbi:MAG: sigma 54-interacting transcriptional regulator [Emergencia sp.]|nr:sigma 54-interacting transcriptional regulator [Emergencia sp.]
MGTIRLSKKEMLTRGGLLDELMDQIFDVSALIDREEKIIHLSKNTFREDLVRSQLVGQHISVLDDVSPFRQVLETGSPATGLLLEINGKNCISNIFPIQDGEEIIGALGTIIFRDMRRMKQIFTRGKTSPGKDVSDIYDNLSRLESGYSFDDFIGNDPTVLDLIDKAKRAAASSLPVLIIGETGTGKEIIAGAIHRARESGQKAHAPSPYVTINCTAIPENLLESELFGYEKGAFTGADEAKAGKFELAAGGDILLDEIGDMNLQMQSKLLRVLESREFERVGGSRILPLQAGIIASTNKNLFMLSEEKKFRADLYFRLNTIELFVPPLRRRPGDIPLLIDYFCEEMDIRLNLTSQAMNLLTGYVWPGNVRQLRNLTQRLSIFYDRLQITEDDIAQELRVGQRTFHEAFGFTAESEDPPLSVMENTERNAILLALRSQDNNISAAARNLGVSRGTFYNKMKKYGLTQNRR